MATPMSEESDNKNLNLPNYLTFQNTANAAFSKLTDTQNKVSSQNNYTQEILLKQDM